MIRLIISLRSSTSPSVSHHLFATYWQVAGGLGGYCVVIIHNSSQASPRTQKSYITRIPFSGLSAMSFREWHLGIIWRTANLLSAFPIFVLYGMRE